MEADAIPAADRLAQALADRDERVRETAAEALIRMGEPAVQPLAIQLSAKEAATRKWAVFALAKLGPLAKPALSELEKRVKDEDVEVRKLADLVVKRLKGTMP
jgi:HEAT repeat protein